MKLSKISLGLVVLCGASAPAFAQQLKASDFSSANAMNIKLSGATAQDNAVASLLTGTLCQAGSLTRYTATNQFVYICTPNTTNITTGGKTQLVVAKNSVGGSAQGVVPVNSGTAIPFLDLALINATTCPASTGSGTSIACPDSAAIFTNTASRIGISDVEPGFFADSSSLGNLTIEPLATVIFGMPVTTVAYNGLQAAQGLTIGATDAANIPTLTQAQVTSLFTQENQTWSGVTGAVTGPTTGLLNNTVHVARRADSSGTQKTYEALIAKTPNGDPSAKSCYPFAKGFLAGAEVLDNAAANIACDGSAGLVLNNSGSGQVQACLARFNTAGIGAIGTLTTEQVSTGSWKHVRVNGLLPNYANVKSGAWTYYGDGALNTRTGALTTEETNFVAALKSKFAIAAAATLHPAFGSTSTDAGRAGLMTLKSVDPTLGQNPWTRVDPATNAVDNCAAAVQANF